MNKSKVINEVKQVIPVLLMALVVSFMMFIYEPFVSYSANCEDFWFDYRALINNNIIFALICFVGISIISLMFYYISKFIKKVKLYDIYLLFMSVGIIATYIQGNYLAGSLPTLDGSPIEWGSYTVQGIISIALWVIVGTINIVFYIQKNKNYKRIISYISLGILAMLTVSLVTVLCTTSKMFAEKGNNTSTIENFNKLSTNKNFVVLVEDMMDSKTFKKVIEDVDKKNILKDFVYFPDTLSTYPFTRESIPYILSGEWYEADSNGMNFQEYYNQALTESNFLKTLYDKKYDVNIYENELKWSDSSALKTGNIKEINYDINKIMFLKQEVKYLLFKYLPFGLKQFSKIETLNYEYCRIGNEKNSEVFLSDNKWGYDLMDKISLQLDNYFQFTHIDGGHYPWTMNGNFEEIENGTYEEKIESGITYLEKYVNRIKESGQYDNTVIIILADHGNNGYDPVGRQNPILYIKGINEHHDETVVSNKKVSYVDLNESIYNDLLEGKQATELLEGVDQNRIRRFIWYKDYEDMYEQTLDGHAWETEKLVPTGKRYKR